MLQELIILFERDLQKLADEIRLYKNESQIRIIAKDIKNSAGNLCLHLVGNLNHFIGAVLGRSGYLRDREAEFSEKGVERRMLIARAEKTIVLIREILEKLDPEDLKKTYPVEVFGKPMSTGYFLIHLYGHLNYHLGQVNYHRRLMD